MEDQQGQTDDPHVVDIPPLAEELRHLLHKDHSLAEQFAGGSPPCAIIIAEVGRLTRNVDEAMYDPHHVSIGPYHLANSPDLALSGEKIRCLGEVLSTASNGGTAALLEVYVEELERLESLARDCYASSFDDMSSREFVRMLLLDGCYLLARFGDVGGRRRINHAHACSGMANAHVVQESSPSVVCNVAGDGLETNAVVRDVFFLAENQVPLFVLDNILQITVSDKSANAAHTIMGYVQELLRGHQYSVARPPLPLRPGNLLHLLHMHLVPTETPSDTAGNNTAGRSKIRTVGRWRTATEYYFVGVTFKKRSLDGKRVQCILDVSMDSGGGTLEIPPLNIDAETWRLLHNLMAFEQRNPERAGSHVTAYCIFMSQLACTAADVDLLSRKGIITHGLGNNSEVAWRFANLCKGILFDPDNPRGNYLRATCQALEKRFQSRLRQWMAWLGRKYFDNPWLAIGLVAAAVGLACTVVQSVYSVLSYK